jgi:hypothetical protein
VAKIVFIADRFDEWRIKGKKDRSTIMQAVVEGSQKYIFSNEAIFCICRVSAGLIHALPL